MSMIIRVRLHALEGHRDSERVFVPVDHEGVPILFNSIDGFSWIQENLSLFEVEEALATYILEGHESDITGYAFAKNREEVLRRFAQLYSGWTPLRLKPYAVVPKYMNSNNIEIDCCD